ncbi:MAG: AMP-binding protein [Bacteroidales bacterium]|nr:AMP-binding protein [Bacteroidales bacterium]
MNTFNYLLDDSCHSGKLFLLGNKEQISYDDLFKKSLNLAQFIRCSYGENNFILLIGPNSVFFIVAYLAIMKSGNTCVPLNPAIEAHNFDYIRKTCNANIAFIDPVLSGKSWPGLEYIHHEFPQTKAANLDALYEEKFDRERLAEVIFTSGSTGEPKGVMLSHGNLIANTDSIVEYLPLGPSDIILIVLPFYYCYGLSLLHTHLKVGGSAVFNNSFMFLGSVLNDLLKYKCTGFSGVPSHFQILLRKSESFKTTKFPDLKYVTQAGGKLHKAFLKEFAESKPEIDFYVMYGQTEATARLSYLPLDMFHKKMGSIGKGIPNVVLELHDENGKKITQPNVNGEIAARGGNIMKGYLNDEASTQRALRDGWLNTNDLAYMDEDGFFFLTARKNEILKVGGKRISPKEIEEVILAIPEVMDCTISGIFDEILGEAIKATIVLSPGKETLINETAIRSHCTRSLDTFKIPRVIEFKDRLKIADTGKKVK